MAIDELELVVGYTIELVLTKACVSHSELTPFFTLIIKFDTTSVPE